MPDGDVWKGWAVMLKQTITETLILVKDSDLADKAVAAGVNCQVMPDAEAPINLTDMRIICVDDVYAEEMAREIAAGGVDEALVEWIDLDAFPEGAEKLLTGKERHSIDVHSRDIHFSEIRTLYDAVEHKELEERIPSGFEFLDTHIKWRRREVVVAAGPYGCGKSTFLQLLALKYASGVGGSYEDHSERQIPVWFCTWEDDPIEQKDQILRHLTHGKCLEGDADQIAAAHRMQKKILYTDPVLERERRLDWYMERARYHHRKHGTCFFILDPWSEFDHVHERDQLETQYVKAVMKLLRRLSVELNSIFIVVTHIGKSKYSDDGGIRPFRVSDSIGSVNFGTSMDRGFCIQRTSALAGNRDHMIVHFDKIKVERTMGRKGTVALSYDENTHNLLIDLDATEQAKTAWSGKRFSTSDKPPSSRWDSSAEMDNFVGDMKGV